MPSRVAGAVERASFRRSASTRQWPRPPASLWRRAGLPHGIEIRTFVQYGCRRMIGSFTYGSMANALPQAIGAQ
ncbi:hypothetical protein GCM10009579_49670 [Streptomyces javensis]|uniref:Uncharacterized protein n=1 Tax=Streptomyces javensis TaxID=114698 RepID=A0ABN1X401_9ACTN